MLLQESKNDDIASWNNLALSILLNCRVKQQILKVKVWMFLTGNFINVKNLTTTLKVYTLGLGLVHTQCYLSIFLLVLAWKVLRPAIQQNFSIWLIDKYRVIHLHDSVLIRNSLIRNTSEILGFFKKQLVKFSKLRNPTGQFFQSKKQQSFCIYISAII